MTDTLMTLILHGGRSVHSHVLLNSTRSGTILASQLTQQHIAALAISCQAGMTCVFECQAAYAVVGVL